VYRIFFSKDFLAKRKQINDICSTLLSLAEGTELHVHTNNQTYYHAQLAAVNKMTNEVTLHIDRFYEHGGETITIHCRNIVAIEFPSDALVAAAEQTAMAIGTTKTDDEDE